MIFCSGRKSRVSCLLKVCCPEDFFFLLLYYSCANCLFVLPYSISYFPTHLLLWLKSVCTSVISLIFAGLRSCCFFWIIEATDWHHLFGANPVTIGMRVNKECTSDAMFPFLGALKWLNAGPGRDIILSSIFFQLSQYSSTVHSVACSVYSVDWILSNHNQTPLSTWTPGGIISPLRNL